MRPASSRWPALPEFLLELGPPLGMDASFRGNEAKIQLFLSELELPTYHQFKDVQF